MRKPVIRSLLAGAALVVPGVAAIPAVAAPDAGTTGTDTTAVVHQELATTTAEQRSVIEYWTPERMRAASPADIQVDATTGTTTAPSAQAEAAAAAEPETPQPELGKVFFTIGGVDYVCSGTATDSANGSVVTTAGHCLHEGGSGGFASQFTFVPAYDDGAAPHGQWTASDLFTSSGWANSGDFAVDVGFAVMNDSGGQSLTDAVGSYPIGFDQGRGLSYTSYGYPAASPFDGESLFSCSGTAGNDPGGSTTQGITCDMTGGSSGGGWITGGQLNSVNSYKYNNDPTTMYGPYFGEVAQSVYDSAAGS